MTAKQHSTDWDKWLTLVFYALVALTLLGYFLLKDSAPLVVYCIGMSAVVVRIVYYIRRVIIGIKERKN